MSNDEFESWLSLVGRLLGLSASQRKQISEELRDHLESRVADLVEDGMERQAAILKAVEEFGDAAVLVKNLQSVSLNNRKRWMMRFMTLATAAMFLVAVLTMAMWPEQARFGSPSQSVAQDNPFGNGDDQDANKDVFGDSDQDAVKDLFGGSAAEPESKPDVRPSFRTESHGTIRRKLNQEMDLVYEQTSFGDVRQQLSKALKTNIVIDMNLEGVLDDDTEVTANLVGVRLSDALRTMLRAVDATYAIKDGVLLIISIDDEHEPDYLTRRMIDVGQVLKLVKSKEADRIGKPLAIHGGGGGGGGGFGGGGGGGVFRVDPQLAAEGTTAEKPAAEDEKPVPQDGGFGGGGGGATSMLTAEQLLVDTITRVVSPDAWQDNGGGNSDLTCIGGVLVVLTNESLADEVQDFVTDLEYQLKNQDD